MQVYVRAALGQQDIFDLSPAIASCSTEDLMFSLSQTDQ